MQENELTGLAEGRWSFWDFLGYVALAAAIVIPVRLWIGQPFIVSGDSMDPTFYNGDYLIVDEFSYHFRAPDKNEVIVFRYPEDPSKFFIKRVIGLPGETVYYNGNQIILGERQYFVVGDNRAVSSDSRLWGPLDERYVVGRAFLRLWPLNGLDLLPGRDLPENLPAVLRVE